MTIGGIIFIIVCSIIIVGFFSWMLVAGGHEYTSEENDDEV
jgi:hypothetical protein